MKASKSRIVLALALDADGGEVSEGTLARKPFVTLFFRANGETFYRKAGLPDSFELRFNDLSAPSREAFRSALGRLARRLRGKTSTLAAATPPGAGGRRAPRTSARLASARELLALVEREREAVIRWGD